MTQRSPLTPEERAKIVSLLREGGLSQGAIARLVGRAQSTVSSIAAAEGLSAPRHKTPVAANHARKEYARRERRLLLDKFLGLLEAMIDQGRVTARQAKELSQALSTAIEKRRLEDDEAGSISETCSGHPHHHTKPFNLEEEFKRLDEALEEEQRREEQQRHHQAFEGE